MVGKKCQQNNPTIAPNIFYTKEKEILPVFISKHNPTHEKQIIFLKIPNEEKEGWHYLAVKKLFALLHKKLQNMSVFFIVWILLILLEQKINLNLMKKCVKIKISMEL